jgi:hypothetical protein
MGEISYILTSVIKSMNTKTVSLTIGLLVLATVGSTIGAGMLLSQQAEAAKSGVSWEYCFWGGMGYQCFTNHGECNKAQASTSNAETDCFRRNTLA